MFIQLDFESEIPIYEQLKNELMIGIAKGVLQAGERLPSVRSMASDIGINLHTVNKAYQQLQQDGFLLIHRQRGVIVNPDGPGVVDASFKAQLQTTITPLIAHAICRGMTKEDMQTLLGEIYDDIKVGDKDV